MARLGAGFLTQMEEHSRGTVTSTRCPISSGLARGPLSRPAEQERRVQHGLMRPARIILAISGSTHCPDTPVGYHALDLRAAASAARRHRTPDH